MTYWLKLNSFKDLTHHHILMNTNQLFESWRLIKDPNNSWGLAWFLANEFCKRFYASHGLVPYVICKEGMDYYGISINNLPCKVNGTANDQSIGRFSMNGNAENWVTGNNDCRLPEMCMSGMETMDLIRESLLHFNLPVIPRKSHLNCRHKRWGDSYKLCFEVATNIALRLECNDISIYNNPDHIREELSQNASPNMTEHPGGFLFVRGEKKLFISGDGVVHNGKDISFWDEYMKGSSSTRISQYVLNKLYSYGEQPPIIHKTSK